MRAILRQGFDLRLAKDGMLGRGIYYSGSTSQGIQPVTKGTLCFLGGRGYIRI